MLSYQHAYHAGNLADLHKHALLARMLAYVTAKPKPLSYLETHAGRALYDLGAPEARRTREAEAGIERALAEGWLPPGEPLLQVLGRVRKREGARAYPGSPLIAAEMLRPGDRIDLAELHPAEAEALEAAMSGRARIHREDGFGMAGRLCPPEPRRGLMLVDPSWEVKADYDRLPAFVARIARKWNVGVIALWVPILGDLRHAGMLAALTAGHPEALWSEVRFPPAREGHGMVGSGIFVVNPPWGTAEAAAAIEGIFRARV
ncbi:23S rRNA (adenine(2030)-N(6))-methyltransferase RlmJ [Paracoccus sp. S-4012]|uniref:23S rRNA (adenine(2030)-N(6))-methyltransferase RlmJ n=1 Tax=Paracoccus sp. S-4012 TaxID=2665648 RepID=UPI0012B04C1E|nr:23S rRNA (adenine(2030)-N(6))-methyltransferase RlmJ [Paracoccus sp. S-4012]MRX50237.1 23S rRNA (adenine(2030)-N(6))-methyltransferase RlmJ [Paracoccus sp. S-4012]